MDKHLAPRQMPTATPDPADCREALDIVMLGLPDHAAAHLLNSHHFFIYCKGYVHLFSL
jgi:hypothetical protein